MSAPEQAPTEIIEAAARAEWIVQCEQSQTFTASLGLPGADVPPWEDVAEPIRERTRERIRPAIQAAWPMIAAQAYLDAAEWAATDPDLMEDLANVQDPVQPLRDILRFYATIPDDIRTNASAQTTEETTR